MKTVQPKPLVFGTDGGRMLAPRAVLLLEEPALLWRVASGAMRIDAGLPGEATPFVRLALPGDVLGVERWAGTNDSLRFQALIDTRVHPVDAHGVAMMHVLMETVVISHQRCREVVSLRTGPVAKRLRALLMMFAQVSTDSGSGLLEARAHAFAIPRTSDIGDIVDAAPATVTRTLNGLHDLLVFHDGRQLMARPSNRALRELETMDIKQGWHSLLSPGVGRPL